MNKFDAIQNIVSQDIKKAEATQEMKDEMGTTQRLFGPEVDENEDGAPRYNADETAMLNGDMEGVKGPGVYFNDKRADMIYQREFKPNPAAFLEQVDAKISELEEVGFSDEKYDEAKQEIEHYSKTKEAFTQMLQYEEAYKENYKAALEHLKRTGDSLPLLEVKGVIPPQPKPSAAEIARTERVKQILEKAKKTGDWTHFMRLTGG